MTQTITPLELLLSLDISNVSLTVNGRVESINVPRFIETMTALNKNNEFSVKQDSLYKHVYFVNTPRFEYRINVF